MALFRRCAERDIALGLLAVSTGDRRSAAYYGSQGKGRRVLQVYRGCEARARRNTTVIGCGLGTR